MTLQDAIEWVQGKRTHSSRFNVTYASPDAIDTVKQRSMLMVACERADAATTERAYWMLRAESEDVALASIGRGAK